MSLRKVSLFALSLAFTAGLALSSAQAADAPAAAPAAPAAMTKEQVEKIVQEYIMNNPRVILESVDNYQRRSQEEQSAEGLKKNKDALQEGPMTGNAKGDITVVEFFDYNCHFCKTALPTIQTLLEKDKKVRIVFKDFPILGPSSETAAKWALAAEKQKKYYAFHQKLMENKSPINDDLLKKLAKDVGMDVEQAAKDADSAEVEAEIKKNRALASELGINGTPAFIVGNNLNRGAVPADEIMKQIAEQRKK